mmetsp:Transcript_105476/g.308377  ORF Transcript_105476/g.308377 Transcript_105476/m.308377 type:complete len:275 (-) Transcript_105476:89-913(-)
MQLRKEEHLAAQQEVLDAIRNLYLPPQLLLVDLVLMRYDVTPHQDGDDQLLPECEEDDALYAQELQDRPDFLELLADHGVEQREVIHRHSARARFQELRDQRQALEPDGVQILLAQYPEHGVRHEDREHHRDVLEDPQDNARYEVWSRPVLRQEPAHGQWMLEGLLLLCELLCEALGPAQEGEHELHEGDDGQGLIHLPHEGQQLSQAEVVPLKHEASPRIQAIDGHDGENSTRAHPELGLVATQVHEDLDAGNQYSTKGQHPSNHLLQVMGSP